MMLNDDKQTFPLISVITVVFNSQSLIKKTIESVLQQTYDNVEFIIIDGASTDGTLDIIRSYDSHIDKWISENDRGIYDAMNKGINIANGDYLLFLNAGDIFSNKKVLEFVSKSIVASRYPEVLYGETYIYTKNNELIKKLAPLRFTRLNLLLFGTRTVCHQSIFVRKNFAPKYALTYKLKGDLCWYYDMFEKDRRLNAVFLPYPIANYLLGGRADVFFGLSIWETLRVTLKKAGIIGCFIVFPLLIIPLVFRLKQFFVNYTKSMTTKE